jgi:hypothetical protein
MLTPDEIQALQQPALHSSASSQWKQSARAQQPLAINPHKFYSPAEIAALLDVSYDTAVRRMEKMHGCINMGPVERRYKRGKRMLRISGTHLRVYLDGKQI